MFSYKIKSTINAILTSRKKTKTGNLLDNLPDKINIKFANKFYRKDAK